MWFQRFILLLVFAGSMLAIYFANLAYQSGLGRRAMDQTGITSYPLDEALLKARAEDKMVLIDVSAIWCPVCRAKDTCVLSNPTVQDFLKQNYIYCRMEYNSPEGAEFLKVHDTKGFPNMWVLDKYGLVVKHLPLCLTMERFMGELP